MPSQTTDRPHSQALNTSSGGGQPRRPQWKPSNRTRREKEPENAAKVLCCTCNRLANTPGHVQPCTMPKVCWNCDKSCPQPRPKERKPRKGKPARINHVTPAAVTPSPPTGPAASTPSPPVVSAVINAISAAHKGSAVWSVHSTASEAALKAASPFVVWDFNAPTGSKLQSVWGVAGVYDMGQLTSSAVVMRKSFFEQHFGLDWIQLAGSERDKVASAGLSSMVAVGSAVMYLSVAGLPALSPIPARITLCESMEPDFLVGKVLQDRWNWSIKIQDGQEHWEAGGDIVATLTTAGADFFNAGLAEREKASHHHHPEERVVVNPR